MRAIAIAAVFGENLRAQREAADLSQEELGYRASLHRTEISLLERGSRLPRIDTLLKLAGGVEAAPGELLAGIEWRPGRLAVGGFSVAADQPPREEARD
jgi:transcriptional regulator with XRE-family HTH domain